MAPIGRLERVALREVWPHEALDFTRWLEENADALADVLDFTPSNIERERAAGSFSVDLVAEDDDGRAVVTWISASTGRSGVHLVYTVRQHDAGVYLYLEGPDAGVNHALFEQPQGHRAEIEKAFGAPLEWDHQDGRKKCSVGIRLEAGGYRSSDDEIPGIQDEMIETMIRLEAALRAYLNALR